MTLLLTFIFLCIVAGTAIALLGKQFARNGVQSPWPLYTRKPLSVPEQVLYYRIREAMPECMVLAQVEMTRVVGIKKGPAHRLMRNVLRGMSLDYVLCLKDSTVVCAIELDDSSHDTPKGRERQAKKDKALQAAGLPIVRWRTTELPSVEEIRGRIAA